MTDTKPITIRYGRWIKYANSVGDFNPIHRNEEFAKSKGLEGVIAPGMFIASHIQGQEQIRKISLTFRKMVYDGETIRTEETLRGLSLIRDEEEVCEATIEFGGYSEQAQPLKETAHTYETPLTMNRIRDYLYSLNLKLNRNPEMFLASLSAPALLSYGKKQGKDSGIHAFQSIEIYHPYDIGRMEVELGDIRARKNLEFINLLWKQDGKMIASGKAVVASNAA